MPTGSQIEFFDRLLEEKDFGPKSNIIKIAEEFSTLNKKSASAWIEKALSLPKKDESEEAVVAPSF